MKNEIDCRGLACPAPVIQTKECIEREHPGIIKITVDNEAAKQNVTRFLESQKYEVSVKKDGPDFHITGAAGEDAGYAARRGRNTGRGKKENHGHGGHGPNGVRGRRTGA